MQALFDIIKSIGEFFSNVISFVVTIFSDLIYVIKSIGTAISRIPNYIGWLPASISALFLVALSIIIVYKVVGRD